MNDKTWYDETKELFALKINDSYVLNLAISVLDDRKELLNENLKLREQLEQKEDIINKVKEYIKENTVKNKFGEEYYIDEFDRFSRPSKVLEILDNKGE